MKDYRDKSFWLATYGEYLPNEALQGDKKVDVAIIGGGFTGLSTAINLRKDAPGLQVAVLEGRGDRLWRQRSQWRLLHDPLRTRAGGDQGLLRAPAHGRGPPLHGTRGRLCGCAG